MEVGPGSVDCQVLLLDTVNAEDGLVHGQSLQDVHRSSYLATLEVHRSVEPSHDLDVVAGG